MRSAIGDALRRGSDKDKGQKGIGRAIDLRTGKVFWYCFEFQSLRSKEEGSKW